MKTLKEPTLTDEECKTLSANLGIKVFNQRAFDGPKLAMKTYTDYIDTVHSFKDERYDAIAKKFEAKVLILGLGWGANILKALANPKVESLTVIEIRKEVVELFYIINGRDFAGVEKLNIIVMDALEFKETDFDHVFVDCFHTPFDYGWYLSLKEIFDERFGHTNLHYIKIK